VGGGFLQKICDELGVELVVQKAEMRQEKLECYSCSRQRRSLIFNAAKERGISTIAFGHHRDDNIQTLLMNLLHKAEFAGILPKVPMHDYGITLIRPLLYITEEEIRSFATLYGFARITCQCPVGQVSLRADTKNLLLELEKIFPNARENLSQAAFSYGSNKALQK
jgi:tRNA(Ile)-lysidine synthase TilS/MesJ